MTETTILALYGLLVIVTLVLQATGAMSQLGLGYLISARDEKRTVSGMSGRLDRALGNSVTAMALFAPAILLHVVGDSTSGQTRTLAMAFLLGRVVYLPAYVFGITGLRTLAWSVGFIATAVLYFLAL
ncbi:MAG: MAPEG family protein [Rhodobacteraceae bacterium]|nr:MAPEG family protein [Paracoccaceae bacterium]